MAKTKQAFTLIELLVVIAIIGVLATVSIIALSNARAKSRDAKRLGDLKQMQTALEMYFNDKGAYPLSIDNGIFSTSSGATSTYMQITPAAPSPADNCTAAENSYIYTVLDNGASYTLSTCLGGSVGSLSPGSVCITPGGLANGSCASRFAVNWGGADDQYLYSAMDANDGGYLAFGFGNNSGDNDLYLAKTDNAGAIVWENYYGGSYSNLVHGAALERVSNSGYIFAGNETVSLNDNNIIIYKVDNSGNVLPGWPMTAEFTGSKSNFPRALKSVAGGYIVGGGYYLLGSGTPNILIMKFDNDGNKLWEKGYGTTGTEEAYDIAPTSDGGYVLTGRYGSTAFVMKTDANGEYSTTGWLRTYTEFGRGRGIEENSDGTYTVVSGVSGDFVLTKLSSTGDIIWNQTYTTDAYDSPYSLNKTFDGGYILGGSASVDDDDLHIIKTDADGNLEWSRTFARPGTYELMYGNGVRQANDGGYLLAGDTDANAYDFNLIKTDSSGNVQ
jgi:prepilin-type N-terminal cleavage/methylation domain-containing protein